MDLDDTVQSAMEAIRQLPDGIAESEEVKQELERVASLVEDDATIDYYRGILHALILIANLGNPLVNFSYVTAISELFYVAGRKWEEAQQREKEWFEGNIS